MEELFMPMNLNGKLENFENAKKAYAESVTNKASVEEQAAAYDNMMNALSSDLQDRMDEGMKDFQAELDNLEANRRVDKKITNNEVKFFNEIKTNTDNKNTAILPEETVDQIFDELTSEHPLLAALGLKTTGLRLKFLRAEATGAAVWGKVFDEIKGQLDQVFSDEDATQSKLTAFVAIPKDAVNYGAAWIKNFVVTQIKEVFAAALEEAFLTGDGKDKPIGLTRETKEGTSVTDGVYPEKTSAGTLTFADNDTTKKEIGKLVKTLSVKESGDPINVTGKVNLVVRPGDVISIQSATFMQNVNGQWVQALPFGINVIESVFVPENKAIAFVSDRYEAYIAGGVDINLFKETLAIEDMDLYTAKQFAYGKAKDGNTSAVYDLKIDLDPKA